MLAYIFLNFAFALDCTKRGSYKGMVSKTLRGYACQRWDTNRPGKPNYTPDKTNHNFCRNPNNDPNGPWCYVNATQWDYCFVEDCHCEKHCLMLGDNGLTYNGKLAETQSGFQCQQWNRQHPHRTFIRPAKINHNYCRNPNNDPNGPWCYTTNPFVRWDYCHLPTCQAGTDCVTSTTTTTTTTTGSISTKNKSSTKFTTTPSSNTSTRTTKSSKTTASASTTKTTTSTSTTTTTTTSTRTTSSTTTTTRKPKHSTKCGLNSDSYTLPERFTSITNMGKFGKIISHKRKISQTLVTSQNNSNMMNMFRVINGEEATDGVTQYKQSYLINITLAFTTPSSASGFICKEFNILWWLNFITKMDNNCGSLYTRITVQTVACNSWPLKAALQWCKKGETFSRV